MEKKSSNTALPVPKHPRFSILDGIVLVVVCTLLCYGASWQFFKTYTDAAKYECYAVAFLHGVSALQQFPPSQCDFIFHPIIEPLSNTTILAAMQRAGLPAPLLQFVASQSPEHAFQALPYEYPLLTLLPFALPLLAPTYWYQVAFALWMMLVVVAMYGLLLRWKSRRVALVFALYLLASGWATVAGRFDIIPAALTLGALLLAERGRWNWAFALLALGTLFKFYPLVLLLPFLLAQQLSSQERWIAWRRWSALLTFVTVCSLVTIISFVLSVQGTLAPFSYFGTRPIHIESFSASLLWLFSLVGGAPLEHIVSYGSLNVLSPFSTLIGLVGTLCLGAGLLFTCWLQWRGRIGLAMACLLTLLVVVFTGKVFSPQYLIWLAPLVVYALEDRPAWVISWTVIGVLTSWIYPYIYNMTKSLALVPYLPLFYPITTLRNFLLLGFILCLFVVCLRRFSLSGKQTSDASTDKAHPCEHINR